MWPLRNHLIRIYTFCIVRQILNFACAWEVIFNIISSAVIDSDQQFNGARTPQTSDRTTNTGLSRQNGLIMTAHQRLTPNISLSAVIDSRRQVIIKPVWVAKRLHNRQNQRRLIILVVFLIGVYTLLILTPPREIQSQRFGKSPEILFSLPLGNKVITK